MGSQNSGLGHQPTDLVAVFPTRCHSWKAADFQLLYLMGSKRARDLPKCTHGFTCGEALTPSPPHHPAHIHKQSPSFRQESLLARRYTEMWLSCLGASLASPHCSPALLPASLSPLTSTRTWAWHRVYDCSFCCLWSSLSASRCQGGLGFSRAERSGLSNSTLPG